MKTCPACDRHIPESDERTTCPFCEHTLDESKRPSSKKWLILGIGVGVTVAAATAYVLLDDASQEHEEATQPVYGAAVTF